MSTKKFVEPSSRVIYIDPNPSIFISTYINGEVNAAQFSILQSIIGNRPKGRFILEQDYQSLLKAARLGG